jgi:hypothetical protein
MVGCEWKMRNRSLELSLYESEVFDDVQFWLQECLLYQLSEPYMITFIG